MLKFGASRFTNTGKTLKLRNFDLQHMISKIYFEMLPVSQVRPKHRTKASG